MVGIIIDILKLSVFNQITTENQGGILKKVHERFWELIKWLFDEFAS